MCLEHVNIIISVRVDGAPHDNDAVTGKKTHTQFPRMPLSEDTNGAKGTSAAGTAAYTTCNAQSLLFVRLSPRLGSCAITAVR